MSGRGEEIRRPTGWIVRAASAKAWKAWRELRSQVPGNCDRCWLDLTDDPRRVDDRQHPLSGSLGTVKHDNRNLEQWQYEVTSGGRIWYAIDDTETTIWLTKVAAGHPKASERRNR
ncbi:hypothetical protein [Nonomuraea fuscirosea]|uniref:hypothetical protein n=1 Tax=Nonomuraea fuscirosea TaxID=1291556 RepID=UPI003407E32F